MTKYFLLLLFVVTSLQLSAQTDERREKEAARDLDYYSDERPSQQRADGFGQNLWWGGGVQLGFQGSNFQSFFNVGLSPMVGYKLTNIISVGPRVSVNYNSFKQRNTGSDDFTSNYFTWAAGLFARARVFGPIFAHAEYSLESDVIGFNGIDNEPVRRNRGVPYLGAGYSQPNPGGASTEIVILFRLNGSSRFINESPFVFRGGINFNF